VLHAAVEKRKQHEAEEHPDGELLADNLTVGQQWFKA
jgi:hypothetical protein